MTFDDLSRAQGGGGGGGGGDGGGGGGGGSGSGRVLHHPSVLSSCFLW